MRPCRGLILGLLTGLLVGCASGEPVRSKAWLDKFRRGAGPSGPDVVQIDVALIERPVGDKYLNKDLWESADELIALETKASLESNGFRIGQVGGITPTGLQELLKSPKSCANPRRIQQHAGKPVRVDIGPATPVCRFQVPRDGAPVPIELHDAQCMLEVTPVLNPDGRTVRLHFEPQVRHGKAALLPQPSADRTGWVVQSEQPAEHYPNLNWDVTLATSEYVVIGGRFDLPQSLGHQCFIRRDERTPVQRLLVIRTGRATSLPGDPLIADPSAATRSPTLARHAAYSANPMARGSSD